MPHFKTEMHYFIWHLYQYIYTEAFTIAMTKRYLINAL
jgi:hypothetical protein